MNGSKIFWLVALASLPLVGSARAGSAFSTNTLFLALGKLGLKKRHFCHFPGLAFGLVGDPMIYCHKLRIFKKCIHKELLEKSAKNSQM